MICSENNNNDIFKVPKLISKASLERITMTSSQYKSDILPKIVSNFKKPNISERMMIISSAWLINNSSAEERHVKRRRIMRHDMPQLSYSVGFMFIRDFQELRQIAQSGKIENGNVKNSHLATSSFGVSLCQFADIYHPGCERTGIPDSGYLLLVKYLKGKINYVPCDSSPMDPQPLFDCHMIKNPTLNSNTICSEAFHKTQVFIYEYNEDGDIKTCQSKILPFGAVQFKWTGPRLFKLTNKDVQKSLSCNDGTKEVQIIDRAISDNKRHISSFSILRNNATSVIPLKFSLSGLSNMKLKSNAYLYLTNSLNSLLRSDEVLEISGIITEDDFENELKRIQSNYTSLICPKSSKDVIDPLSHDIIISLNRTNLLNSTIINCESTFYDELQALPQFVTYIRIVFESYKYSKRLNDLFTLSKTIGFIDRSHNTDISIAIFPDGKISKNLGITSINGVCYLHGLIFHSQHPQFVILNYTAETMKEKNIYFSCVGAHKKQCILSKFNSTSPLIDFDVLKQTVKSQADVQRAFLFKIIRPQDSVTSFKPICFQSDCEDFNCDYHNPVKRIRSDVTTNKENIKSSNTNAYQSLDITNKGNERLCLSEKLFDYFKNGLAESSNDDIVMDINTLPEKSHNQQTLENIYLEHKEYHLCNIPNTEKTETNIGGCNGSLNVRDTKGFCCHIYHKEEDNGSFFNLEFQTYCIANYSDSDGQRTKDFKYPTTNGYYDVRKEKSADLWSFNKGRFRQINDWPGISSYE